MAQTAQGARKQRAAPKVDGRNARREANRLAVLDAVLELMNERDLIPTAAKVSERSGLSLRSVYRYYDDTDTLLQAAIERSFELATPAVYVDDVGVGTLEDRIDRLVESRIKVFQRFGGHWRAAHHHAPINPTLQQGLDAARAGLTTQTEAHFEPELAALSKSGRKTTLAACDALTQFLTFEFLTRHQRLTLAQAKETIRQALAALLEPAARG